MPCKCWGLKKYLCPAGCKTEILIKMLTLVNLLTTVDGFWFQLCVYLYFLIFLQKMVSSCKFKNTNKNRSIISLKDGPFSQN